MFFVLSWLSTSSMRSGTPTNRAKGPCQNGLKGPSSGNKSPDISCFTPLGVRLAISGNVGVAIIQRAMRCIMMHKRDMNKTYTIR